MDLNRIYLFLQRCGLLRLLLLFMLIYLFFFFVSSSFPFDQVKRRPLFGWMLTQMMELCFSSLTTHFIRKFVRSVFRSIWINFSRLMHYGVAADDIVVGQLFL